MPKKFSTVVKDFAQTFGIDCGTAMQAVGLRMYGDMIEHTPRDSGRAAASWNLTVNYVDPSVKPEGDWKSFNPLAFVQLTDLEEVTDGDTVYITNNLPYIVPLERGHSQQAPNGMVATTVRRYKQYMAEEVRNVRRKSKKN